MLVLVTEDGPEVADEDAQEPLNPELDVLVVVAGQLGQQGAQGGDQGSNREERHNWLVIYSGRHYYIELNQRIPLLGEYF